MFFGKKKNLDQVEKTLNKGLTGGLMKAFVPKETRALMNDSLNQAKMAEMAAGGNIMTIAEGKVLEILDTGKIVNYNPVIILKMDLGEGAIYEMEILVSKIALPRIGDIINLGKNPLNENDFIYLGIKEN